MPQKHQTICRIDKKAVSFHIIMTDMLWKPMPYSILMTDDTLSSNSNWVAERLKKRNIKDFQVLVLLFLGGL